MYSSSAIFSVWFRLNHELRKTLDVIMPKKSLFTKFCFGDSKQYVVSVSSQASKY